jgi:hypothetical protein
MAAVAATKVMRRKGRQSNVAILSVVLFICIFFTLAMNLLHVSAIHSLDTTHLLDSFINSTTSTGNTPHDHDHTSLAGLSCEKYGGPEDAEEMVYWRDVREDAEYKSPFHDPNKYMTFEPDQGGWNNIRMSMETVLAMAHAMGRILVLPPEQRMYLLGGNKDRRHFSFQDFYPMEQIAKEHEGLDIITMEDFLVKVAMTGQLADSSGKTSFPPENRTNWNGLSSQVIQQLNPWLRSVMIMPEWDPNECLAGFPSSQDSTADLQKLQDYLSTTPDLPTYEDYIGKPTAVNAPAQDRLLENLAERKKLCIYDQTLQEAHVLHFHGSSKLGGRLLVHFYAFLFFNDWNADLLMKRFVRDHVRYIDEIQCAAARIIQAVREKSRQGGNKGEYDAFHIRRGDFQYKATRVEASEIYNISKDVIPEKSTVYIGTDERNKTFFNDLSKHYDISFLDDYLHLVEGMNPSYYGMLDQLITSRSRFFFGCWFSTFTSYVNRLRGHHSQKAKLKGYNEGVIQSWYYAMPEKKLTMREFWPVKKAFHAREFPTSWLNIDMHIDQ